MTMTLFLAVVAMLAQQTIAYMSTLVLPVVAPEAARELGVSTALIGAYSLFLYFSAVLSAMICGSFIRRYGALRASQGALCLLGIGLLMASPGIIWLFPFAALVIGLGSGVSTPASSEILARYSPPRHAPLIFSIKQTGVPLGGILAGLLVPLFAATMGWRGGFVASSVICLVLAVVLQPLRARFDHDRQPDYPIGVAGVWRTQRRVVGERQLRELAIASFAFVGAQSIFGNYLVTWMVEGLNYGLAEAGQIFAVGQGVAVAARIGWGWMAGRLNIARPTLAALGLSISAACIYVAWIEAGAGTAVVMAGSILYAATAMSWHGVLLSEIARRSPRGEVGQFTGGILAFGSLGMMTFPGIFGMLLASTGGYTLGFVLAGLPAAFAGLLFLLPLPQANEDSPRPGSLT